MVELQSGASVPPRLSLMHQAQQPQQALQPKQALQLQQQPRRGRRRAMRTAMQMQSIIGRSLDQVSALKAALGGSPGESCCEICPVRVRRWLRVRRGSMQL